MKRTITSIGLFIFTLTLAPGIDFTVTERALNHAMSEVPNRFTYSERAGALGIFLEKQIEYVIVESEEVYVAEVVSVEGSSRNRRDPREPVALGDTSDFDIRRRIDAINPFNAALAATPLFEVGREVVRGVRTIKYTFYFEFRSDSENPQSARGELFLDESNSLPVLLFGEIVDLSRKQYLVEWHLFFDGNAAETCRLAEIEFENQGKYSFFKYRFITVESFEY